MASCDEPGTSSRTNVHIHDQENTDGDVRDLGIVSLGEGPGPNPRTVPDLCVSFSSFTQDNPFVNGTPSGEVLFRMPRRIEHVGEPAQHTLSAPNISTGNQSKEMEEIRRQLAVITARLGNCDTGLQRNFTEPTIHPAIHPSVDPYRSGSVFNDQSNQISGYNGFQSYRDQSYTPSHEQSYPPIHTRSANVIPSNRAIDNIKIAQFDGKTSWKDYLVQFELAAHANRWDRHTRAVRLACSLRGSAQALLSDLTPEVRYDYDRLVTTLTERFEPENQCEIYKAQMKQRVRKRDEQLPELAQDIKRLTRMAYPTAVLDLRDTLSKDCFIEALNDVDLELFICQKEPERLEDAVRIALKYEAFSQGRRKRLALSRTGIRMQHEDVPNSAVSRNEIQDIKSELRELRANSGAQTGSGKFGPYNQGCFTCGDPLHFRRDCPNNRVEGNEYNQFGTRNRNSTGFYGSGNRNGRFNGKFNNQSTDRTIGRPQPNTRPTKAQGNCQKLRPWVEPQL